MLKPTLILTFVILVVGLTASFKITPKVREDLKLFGKTNVFIIMRARTGPILDQIDNTSFTSRTARLNALASALERHATRTQAMVLMFLRSAGVRYDAYWISNTIFVSDASIVLLTTLSTLPDVLRIEEERVYQVESPTHVDVNVNAVLRQSSGNAWGIDKIEAPAAWRMTGGNNGGNIVVSNIDTGVRYTHESLSGNYRSSYGWYDPYARTSSPNDQNGHGTHTMGTIAGSKGIGVAPGSKWIACKGCDNTNCNGNALTSCGQWITCPTLANGNSKDCSKAPHLVSNSWGGGQGDTWYNDVIRAWKSAKIVPVFAIGNDGPNCGTASSPGDQDVISVGATNSSDGLANFSSKGPGKSGGKIKPEMSAPGASIKSASYQSNTAYSTMSGTSMACPHVAGTVALMLSAQQNLSYDDVMKYLAEGCVTSGLAKTGYNCGGVAETNFPNNEYGAGRINAHRSLQIVLNN